MTTENSYINRQIGNYRVISELANGSFGRVYLAQHVLLKKRMVAIKLLHAIYLGSSEERERFLQEAQFLEQLKHSHILPIIDVSIEDGLPYLVAEYTPNGSLRDRIKSCAPQLLPLQETLTILIQIGQALHYAHQQKIIHRDLKPENILFNAKNDVLLADFGLATSVSTISMKHVDNAGTPRYMAPEQFRGNVSKESDQYSLACIAYELVTGHQPFTDTEIFTLAFKHLTEEPIPPTQLNPDLPMAVEQVILKAMSKQRADRYPDIASFITALVNSATSQPHSLKSSLAEFPTIENGYSTSTGLKSTAPTLVPASTYNSSLGITKVGTPESKNGSTVLDGRQYKTTPIGANADPLTPIPPSYDPNPVTPFPLLDANKQDVTRTSPADVFVNNTQILSPDSWTVRNISQKRKPRWLIIAIVCMVVFASVIGIFVIPGFISQSTMSKSTPVKSAKLVIQTSTLDFGKPAKGIKAILTIEIDNKGEHSLDWTADTGGVAWLTLNPGAGSIEPGHFQLIYVTADTTHLALQVYTATIAINSNGGNKVVGVKLNVQPPPLHPQAKLNVNPSSLNFGPLGANTQATLAVTVGNVGNQALNWTANIANAPWLTIPINNRSGTVQPGGLPQQIQVTANTSQLVAGPHSANLSITSNGGKATVQVTLEVSALPVTPTLTSVPPAPTPTSVPPTPTPTSVPPTPTPTSVPPTPTPTSVPPTPSPTPPPQYLTLYFTDPNGVTTTNPYSGSVTIMVSGTGVADQTQQSDAFYIFTDNAGNPVTPYHPSCWDMYINGQRADNFGPIPPYNSNHSYQFTMTGPGVPLSFVICDGIHSDNNGSLTIIVSANGSSSSAAEVSSTSNIQVGASSTDMLAEENKKIEVASLESAG